MEYVIFDIETNGLMPGVSKIHCLSFSKFIGKDLVSKGSITDYEQIKKFVLNQKILVGHNIIEYDIPVLEKILDIKIECLLIDTIAISFYHHPVKKFKHGLGPWGERLGFGKPVVDDWEDQPIEVYINRCESDVEINTRLFHYQMDYTMEIYNNFDEVMRLFGYLGYKLDCMREQAEERIKLDVRLVEKSAMDLEFIIDEKMSILSSYMPRMVDKTMPKLMYKKDGSLSAHGEKWMALLKLKGLPSDSTVITVPGNPGSSPQLKDWLFELGWVPKTFKENAKGEKIAQVSLPFGKGLCKSVIAMFKEHKFLEELGGLYIARHRAGLFKSYLINMSEDGYVVSGAQGFTNTLRLQHKKPIANLPKVGIFYGKEVRGSLIVPDDSYTFCGSDISGLEDNTKQHYIYFYDPQYVIDMRVPGFDPHIDIAVLSNLISRDDEDFYKNIERRKDEMGKAFVFNGEAEEKRYLHIQKSRGEAKTINFSATYGAGPPKIAATLKCSLEEATVLHSTYWERNKAVKQTAAACIVKVVRGQKWLYNPISGFWMFLKAEKDRFSTLNQSSGVFVFDTWVRYVRTALKPYGIKISLQYHDEILLKCKKTMRDIVDKILKDAMVKVNEELKLNVNIGIDTQFGPSYADCH